MLSKGWWNYFLKAFKTGRTPFEGNKIVGRDSSGNDVDGLNWQDRGLIGINGRF